MSPTFHEEIGRVGRVGRGRYEDASDLSATSRRSCACRARGLWRTTRHADKGAALHRSRRPADQSGKRVNEEVAPTRPTRTTSSQHPRYRMLLVSGVSTTTSRGCCEEDATTRKLLRWNLSLYSDAAAVPLRVQVGRADDQRAALTFEHAWSAIDYFLLFGWF